MTFQVIDVEAIQKFSADGAQPVILHQSEGLVTLLLCLEAGQAVGPCNMMTRVLYLVLMGSAQLRVAREQHELKTGSLVIVPASVTRNLSAQERSRVLAMQIG